MKPVILSLVLIFSGLCMRVQAADETMLQMQLGQRTIMGMALGWSDQRALVLQRDGQILEFSPGQARNIQRVSEPFRAMSAAEIKPRLLAEFGSHFQVQTAGSYVVVHPRGSREAWAQQFDMLHRSFLHYFRSRGIKTAKPRFPMVAVVLPDKLSFMRYAQRDGARVPDNCAGYYSNFTNRVVQYNQGTGQNLELIIHEASHQVAFNTGVHHRGSPPPRWLTEGLGTMFEARGVWNSSNYRELSDRINASQLAAFRQYLPQRPQGSLPSFIAGERLFRSNTAAAYGESWALSFFLSETRPRQWAYYLKLTSDVRRASNIGPTELLHEFMTAFGSDLKMLEMQFLRYIEQL